MAEQRGRRSPSPPGCSSTTRSGSTWCTPGTSPGLGVIWFYKADLDPAVTKTMPRGWKDVDYVVASPTVRRDAVDLPNVKAAIEHSTPVATFGTGADRIEIRQVQTTGTATGGVR